MKASILAIGTVVGLVLSIALFVYVATSFRTLYAEVEESRAELASSRAQLLIASDTVVANRELVDVAIQLVSATRGRCEHPKEGDLNLCQLMKITPVTPLYVDFLAAYTDTTALRTQATTPADFAKVEADYRALLPKVSALGPGATTAQWRSRVMEGIAYAQWKQADLAGSEISIAEAVRLDPDSAFAGLTSLKLMCVRNVPKDEVVKAYTALSARLAALKARTAHSPFKMMAENGALEESYLRRDLSLDHICAYAALRR